ncbi:HTTM domain-containing protein [bacterium]|jgi:vitamin K-dependent gamma-carboxylase|nr:HTTM domain-containing protein [bacterium]
MSAENQSSPWALRFSSWKLYLNEPVSAAPLVFFRLIFGLIMFIEVLRFFHHGWIERYFVEPNFYFPYTGFKWLSPLPGEGMFILFILLGVLSLCIFLGWFYRLAAFFFALGFSYQFLLDQSNYLNHFYLIILLSFLLVVLPSHTYLSIDSLRNPLLRAKTVPFWSLFLLRFQLAIPYVFGGIAKLNADWLQGYPLKYWLLDRMDFPILGPYFNEKGMVLSFAYGGLLFDLLIVPALLYSRTRIPALFALAFFHVTNHMLFTIGIFPWLMLLSTLVFLPPNWSEFLLRFKAGLEHLKTTKPHFGLTKPGMVFLACYISIQILVPLRHYQVSENPSWDEIGHRFAWHMKLRSKRGRVYLQVENLDTRHRHFEDPAHHLSPRQLRKLSTRPIMIHEFARKLKEFLLENGLENVAIRAHAMASLNGRPYQYIIDPTIDLLKIKDPFWQNREWIIPLYTPLQKF